ncbi:MAG: hypothetical protein ACYC1S_11300 [Gemmatimonadaceae bacterium]
MFDHFREALERLVNRAAPPEERRALAADMRETLVRARAGLHDLRDGLEVARHRLAHEQQELETVRRRKALAEGIGDAETVAVADRFEKHHAERVAVLVRKVEAQEAELALTEREVAEMTSALEAAMGGAAPAPASVGAASAAPREVDEAFGVDPAPEIDAMRRRRERAARDEDAARRLEEMKRRMGK